MGGIAAIGLEATEANWAGIKAFHQLYMPSNEAIRMAVQKIRQLDPPPLMIAPQHGGIIQGALINEFLDRMQHLQVGLDIISSLDTKLALLISALNEIILNFRATCGDETTNQVLSYFQPDGSYPALFALASDGSVTDIKGDPVEVVESLLKVFFKLAPPAKHNLLKAKIVRILLDNNLPPFDLLLAQEESDPISLTDALH